MYNSYNTSDKNKNSKIKNNFWYDNGLTKYPVVLPPLDTTYANKFKSMYREKPIYSNKTSKYQVPTNYSLPPSLSHYPGSIARNPYLNPMFEFKYEPSDFFNTTQDSNKIVKTYDDFMEESDDELDYQYQQRDWIKNKSKEIQNDTSASKIKLIRGDVVNIDKKTLVFQNYNSYNRRHVFKELTTLKVYDFDLTSRPYTVVIPSKLKYDIITPSNLIREIKYTDVPLSDDTDLTEGYLSDLENGSRLLTIEEENKLDIISDYVGRKGSVESIYSLETNVSSPKIVIHENDIEDIEELAKHVVDNIIEKAVEKADDKSEVEIKEEKDTSEIEKINLDDEDEPSTWGGWCSIS